MRRCLTVLAATLLASNHGFPSLIFLAIYLILDTGAARVNPKCTLRDRIRQDVLYAEKAGGQRDDKGRHVTELNGAIVCLKLQAERFEGRLE